MCFEEEEPEAGGIIAIAGSPTGLIIIICSSVGLLILVVLIVWCIVRKCNKEAEDEPDDTGDFPRLRKQYTTEPGSDATPIVLRGRVDSAKVKNKRSLQKEFCGTVATFDPTNVDDDGLVYKEDAKPQQPPPAKRSSL